MQPVFVHIGVDSCFLHPPPHPPTPRTLLLTKLDLKVLSGLHCESYETKVREQVTRESPKGIKTKSKTWIKIYSNWKSYFF